MRKNLVQGLQIINFTERHSVSMTLGTLAVNLAPIIPISLVSLNL